MAPLMSSRNRSDDHTVVNVEDKTQRLIVRQRLAIQGLAVLCLVVTMLFVWQLTVNVINKKVK